MEFSLIDRIRERTAQGRDDVRLGIGDDAALVSVPAGTALDTLNEAGPTRPEPPALSLAVQGTVTSVACHAGAGAVQLTVGGIVST